MNADFWIAVILRWLHVGGAVAGIGVVAVLHFVLVPWARTVPHGEDLYRKLLPGLRTLYHSALGLALITGLYNYVVLAIPAVRVRRETVEAMAAYHPAMGMKILLSLLLFGVGAMLLKPSPALDKNRTASTWFALSLGLLLMLGGAFLRRLWNLS